MWIRVVLAPDRQGRGVQPDLGDKRAHRALAKRTSHGDAVVPVEHIVGAAASVELDGVHPAAGSEVGRNWWSKDLAGSTVPTIWLMGTIASSADRRRPTGSYSSRLPEPPAPGALVTSPSTAKRLRLAGRPSSQPAILARAARRRVRSKSSRTSCWTNPVRMLLIMAISHRPCTDPSSAFRC